jgi:hypothetical protein
MRIAVRLLPAVFALLMLTGCTTPVDTRYISRMNGYVGGTEKMLIGGMGVPDKSYELDPLHKLVAYTQVRQGYVDGSSVGMCLGGFSQPFGYSACNDYYPHRVVAEYCDVTFNITRRIVTGWSQKGSACPRIQ